MIVVIIIGILAAIAIPAFLAQRDRANAAACESDTRNAAEAANLYASQNNGSYTGLDADDLATNGFRQTDGVDTTVTVGAGGSSFDLSSTCPGDAGTRTYNSDEGVVVDPAGAADAAG